MADEYEKQANDFLEKHQITFSVMLIGNDCPPFCKDAIKQQSMNEVDRFPRKTHIHGKHYRVTFARADHARSIYPPLVLDFWNSYHDEEYNYLLKHHHDDVTIPYKLFAQHGINPDMLYKGKPRQPTAYDMLAAIQKDDPGTFEDFCANFGYDTDSRRAFSTWEAVVAEWRKVEKFFDSDELSELEGIA